MPIRTFKYNVIENISLTMNLSENFFIFFNIAKKAKYLIHHVLKISNANNRQYTINTKTKSEVRGGGCKPWKQKGTGRARAGSNRSPLWRGGGVIFGPKMKITINKINKKEKQLSLKTFIYNKQKQIFVFNNFDIQKIKTSSILNTLLKININLNLANLIISFKRNQNLKLSVQNLKNCEYIYVYQLHLRSLIKAKIILIDEKSLQFIQEFYCDRK